MIKLKANGKIFEGWLTAKVNRSMNAVSGSFEITYLTHWDDDDLIGHLLQTGDECSLFFNDQILINGFIDQISNSCSSDSLHLSIKGRDRTGDLVDSANILQAKAFRGVSLASMASTLASPFGITISSLSTRGNEPIKNISLQQNETVWESISRLAKYQGVLAYPDKNGGITFSDVGSETIATLKQGDKILDLNFSKNDAEKFQTYKVFVNVGSANVKHKKTIAEIKDNSVKRPRLKQIASSKAITFSEARERAKWEMARQIAKAFSLNITLPSWTNPVGDIWEINKLISIKFPKIGIDGTFLIEETAFDFGSDGFKTDLKLVVKDAYNPRETRDSSDIGDAGEV